MEQTHTARWGAGPADHKRFRADADAQHISAGGFQTSAHARRTRTAEKARRRLQGGDQEDSQSKGERSLGRRSADANRSRSKKEAAIS